MGSGSSVHINAAGWRKPSRNYTPSLLNLREEEVAGDVAGPGTPERTDKAKEVPRDGGVAGPVTPEGERTGKRVILRSDPEVDCRGDTDEPDSPMSPVGKADTIRKDPVSRMWLGGLASAEMQMPPALDASVRAGDRYSVEVAKGKGTVRFGKKDDGIQEFCFPAAKALYYDPRQRVQVSLLDLKLEDLYLVGKTIGRGGFARVRLGQHLESKQKTVLKVIDKMKAGHSYKEFLVDAGIYEMFIKMSKEKRHTNVVRYFDLLESPDHYFVIMERLEGLPLESALTCSGAKWSQGCCAAAMADLLGALHHMHTVVGFYHRDVKIENLRYRCKTDLVSEHMQRFGDLVLFDFGLARFIDQDWDGGYAGTALYAAPEVLRALNTEDCCILSNTGGYSPAVDLWAAGLLLFAFLAGDFPYAEDDLWGGAEWSVLETVKESVQELARLTSSKGISIPRALLEGLLDADPAHRLDASQALQDPWFTRTNGTMASGSYPSLASKETKVPTNDVGYYNAAATKSSASKELKETRVPTNQFQLGVPKSEARYYEAALMKSSASKETERKVESFAGKETERKAEKMTEAQARFNKAAEYLSSLNYSTNSLSATDDYVAEAG
jgi:serine/threonine protein kinase